MYSFSPIKTYLKLKGIYIYWNSLIFLVSIACIIYRKTTVPLTSQQDNHTKTNVTFENCSSQLGNATS